MPRVCRAKGLNRNRHGELRGPTDEEAAKVRGFVYFMQREDESKLIKIGFTMNPRSRRQALSKEFHCGVRVIGVEIGTMLLERQLHVRFEGHCVGREWFEPDGELVGYIEELNYGPRFHQALGDLMAHLHWPDIPNAVMEW
jgi:T5orf172 domain